jgi:hypothetical protein
MDISKTIVQHAASDLHIAADKTLENPWMPTIADVSPKPGVYVSILGAEQVL